MIIDNCERRDKKKKKKKYEVTSKMKIKVEDKYGVGGVCAFMP